MAKPNTCRKLCIHLPQSSYFIINWVLTSHYIFSWCCDQCIMWPSSGAVSSGALRLSLLPAMICLSFIPVPASLAYQGWYTSASSSGLHCDGSSHMTSKKATSFSYRRPTRPPLPEKKHQTRNFLLQSLPICFIWQPLLIPAMNQALRWALERIINEIQFLPLSYFQYGRTDMRIVTWQEGLSWAQIQGLSGMKQGEISST